MEKLKVCKLNLSTWYGIFHFERQQQLPYKQNWNLVTLDCKAKEEKIDRDVFLNKAVWIVKADIVDKDIDVKEETL